MGGTYKKYRVGLNLDSKYHRLPKLSTLKGKVTPSKSNLKFKEKLKEFIEKNEKNKFRYE